MFAPRRCIPDLGIFCQDTDGLLVRCQIDLLSTVKLDSNTSSEYTALRTVHISPFSPDSVNIVQNSAQ